MATQHHSETKLLCDLERTSEAIANWQMRDTLNQREQERRNGLVTLSPTRIDEPVRPVRRSWLTWLFNRSK
jgi:hypothetical protein